MDKKLGDLIGISNVTSKDPAPVPDGDNALGETEDCECAHIKASSTAPKNTSHQHDITSCLTERGRQTDLLQEIVDDLKEDLKNLVPKAGRALGKYVDAKGEEAVARVQEIKARIYENIVKLETERQNLIRQWDEARQKSELEVQRDKNAHERKLKELELRLRRERTQALREIVDCIIRLRENGVMVDSKVVKKAEKVMISLLNGAEAERR